MAYSPLLDALTTTWEHIISGVVKRLIVRKSSLFSIERKVNFLATKRDESNKGVVFSKKRMNKVLMAPACKDTHFSTATSCCFYMKLSTIHE